MTTSLIPHSSRTARLKRQLSEARSRLFDRELDAEIGDVRQRLQAAEEQKRRHDLVNAFSAVEGASLIMSREILSAADRTMIAEVLDSGLSRLRVMLLESAPDERCVPLAELVAALAEEPAWRGRIEIDIAADLVVSGPPNEIAEVIRQLLIHANRHALSAPVSVRAHRNRDRVELWVDDRGPLAPAEQRHAIRHPGGTDAVGALHVAIRFARDQQGDVVVEPRQGGGESLGISWPAYLG